MSALKVLTDVTKTVTMQLALTHVAVIMVIGSTVDSPAMVMDIHID